LPGGSLIVPGVVHALDFSRWKRRPLRLCFPDRRVVCVSSTDRVPDGATLALWGMCAAPDDAARRGLEIVRLEDGFLRSVGLGADLIRPVSWVVDRRGVYFDATRPSDLEALLADADFDDRLLERAAALRSRIVEAGLTKYNVGASAWRRPAGAARVILVPGQVESDASIAYGAPGIRTNLGLLQAVRSANAQAYVVYKPHPDVVAGLRAPGAGEASAAQWCDEIAVDVGMAELLAGVDEVHVLTSLTGFEALLRGKCVTCYGQPFYAGWGLTADVVPVARRTRRLTLDQLVAGALIRYPRYLSRQTDMLISPEQALDELVAWRARSGGAAPWWRRLFRVVLRRVVGVR
jgi:capsular polysaccharide export protein